MLNKVVAVRPHTVDRGGWPCLQTRTTKAAISRRINGIHFPLHPTIPKKTVTVGHMR
jgi:hypothetical protein